MGRVTRVAPSASNAFHITNPWAPSLGSSCAWFPWQRELQLPSCSPSSGMLLPRVPIHRTESTELCVHWDGSSGHSSQHWD